MPGDIPIALKEWRAKARTFAYHDHEVFYVDEGQGDPLVCIHGFPTASWDWAWIWGGLTARYRVIAPDMMGFGFSAKPRDYDYSLRDQATLHEGLLKSLEIDRAYVLCHDYGDSVGQELLARAAEMGLDFEIRAMCLLNGGIIPDVHRPRPMQRLLISPLGPLVGRLMSERSFNRSFSAVFGPDTQPSAEELEAFWSLIHHNQGQRVVHKLIRYMTERVICRDRWVGALQNTPFPLRFINGTLDPVSGQHMVDTYRQLVPDPDVVCLAGIGHYPHVEGPERTLAKVLEFFGRVQVEGR